MRGKCIKLQDEELGNLYSSIISVTKSRRMRWAMHVARKRAIRNSYVLIVTCEGKRPHMGSRRRWEDNIKVGLNTELGSLLANRGKFDI
jgi:hypothetical protein